MSFIVVSYAVVNLLGIVALVAVGLPLLRLIRTDVVAGAGLTAAIGLYQFVIHLRNCYTSYFSCTNRILYVKAFLVSALLCVALGYVFLAVLGYGAWGLVAAQMASQLVFNAWHWMFKAHKEMSLGFAETLKLGFGEIRAMLPKIGKG